MTSTNGRCHECSPVALRPWRLLPRFHRLLLALLVLMAPIPCAARPDLVDVQVSRDGAPVAALRVEGLVARRKPISRTLLAAPLTAVDAASPESWVARAFRKVERAEAAWPRA